jgi:hypothetical protein
LSTQVTFDAANGVSPADQNCSSASAALSSVRGSVSSFHRAMAGDGRSTMNSYDPYPRLPVPSVAWT